VAQILGQSPDRHPTIEQHRGVVVASTLTKAAAGIVEQVTDRQAVFTKRDLLAHVAALYPDGASSAELDGATGQILAAAVHSGEAIALIPPATRDAVALPDGVALTADELTQVLAEQTDGINGKGQQFRALPGEARYTTRLQLEREQRVLVGVHSTSPVTVTLDALEAANLNVVGMSLHPDPVAEDGAAGKTARRIDQNHSGSGDRRWRIDHPGNKAAQCPIIAGEGGLDEV
jgi:hypothetical protein